MKSEATPVLGWSAVAQEAESRGPLQRPRNCVFAAIAPANRISDEETV